MKKLDGRAISPKAMEEIRIRAVQCVQNGESPEVVIATLGFSRACIYNWLARYRSGGSTTKFALTFWSVSFTAWQMMQEIPS